MPWVRTRSTPIRSPRFPADSSCWDRTVDRTCRATATLSADQSCLQAMIPAYRMSSNVELAAPVAGTVLDHPGVGSDAVSACRQELIDRHSGACAVRDAWPAR